MKSLENLFKTHAQMSLSTNFIKVFLLFASFAVSAQSISKYDFNPVESKIQSWIDNGYYEGASVLIAKDNKVVYEKYFGNYTPQSVAYIASAGKWLAAATIAAVVDEGKLSWGDKVVKWLPEFTDLKGQATLRQLLSHTAGYPDYQPVDKQPDHYQTLKEAVANIVALPADTSPGTKFKYGGLAMQIAGRMAELATGKDWETIFQQKMAQPLNMKYTHFTPVDETPGHNPMIGGGARAGLHDYTHFLQMIMNNGVYEGKQVLSAKAIREMQANQLGNAKVVKGEYVENTRATNRTDIYGLGEWREEIDKKGNAVLISSPSWAGAYPWIDKKNNVYGFFLTRISTFKDGFSSFYASPVLPILVRDVLKTSKLPAYVKKEFIDVGGVKLYYEEAGKGEPLIFLHGHSFDHTEWDAQFLEFAKKYRVIRYDLRGYGQSDKQREDVEFLHAEDLYKLMQKLNINKAHVVGLSLGGFIVTDFLALYPEKLLSAVAASGDVFPVPGPDQPWTEETLQKRRIEIEELKKKGIDQFKRQWFASLMSHGGNHLQDIRVPVWNMIYKWDGWQPLHAEPRLLLGNSVVEKLKQQKITIPLLVLTGEVDMANPNKLMECVPSAKRSVVKDAGHVSNMENPESFNREILKFLSEVKQSAFNKIVK